jgi:hypothetical protein
MPPPDRFPVAYATFVRHDLSEQTEAFRYGSDRAERPKVGVSGPAASRVRFAYRDCRIVVESGRGGGPSVDTVVN